MLFILFRPTPPQQILGSEKLCQQYLTSLSCIKSNILELILKLIKQIIYEKKRTAKNWKGNSYCYVLPGTLHVIYFWFMVFKANIKNISVISWLSVLLEEQTRVLGENHRPVTSH